ncbi:hypothetical protein HZB02_00695 [Candidatus Woesearchaeota archaeon]|nr:hypothetical protein [Candidatus Woesearchaeota archaeon]
MLNRKPSNFLHVRHIKLISGIASVDIFYTLHAEEKIADRKVHKVWIEETIKAPDRIFRDGIKHYVVKKLNGKTLQVVCISKKNI